MRITDQAVMVAAEFDEYGPAGVVGIKSVPRPQPTEGESLVRVEASSVNPVDLIIRSGKLRLRTGRRFPKRLRIDFAGQIEEIRGQAGQLAVGDRVWGVMPLTIEKGIGQGSAATYVTIPTDRLARSPRNLDPTQSAAMSSVGAVALITLRDRAQLQPGERLLVRGAAGGVGTMAVQAGVLLGAHVTALASAHDLTFLRELGAAETYDYRTVTPADLAPFDVVLDLVGTDLRHWRKLLTRPGRMYCLSIAGVSTLAYIAVSKVFRSRRVQFFSAAPTGHTMADLTTHAENGTLRPVVHSTYQLTDIVAAQESLEAGGGRGKRVLVHPNS